MEVISDNPEAPLSFWRLPVYQPFITQGSDWCLAITSLPNGDIQQKLKGHGGYHCVVNW